MPRKKNLTPTIRKEIYLPEDLYAILSTLYFDPILERIRYGAFSDYIISLIRADLKARGLLK